jgi:hypothetical protein
VSSDGTDGGDDGPGEDKDAADDGRPGSAIVVDPDAAEDGQDSVDEVRSRGYGTILGV